MIGPSSFAPEPIVTLSCDGRVALARGEPRAAERHPLVERDVVADVRRLTDHDARAVIDEQPVADPCGGMNLDPVSARVSIEMSAAERARRRRRGRVRRDGRTARGSRATWRVSLWAPLRVRRIAIARGQHIATKLLRDPRDRVETGHANSVASIHARPDGLQLTARRRPARRSARRSPA